MDIRRADSGPRFTTFIRLPRLIYDGMEHFVPRLDLGEKLSLSPKHAPFFKHGEAAYFVAFKDGEPAGRVSAQIDALQTGEYGMFGCLDAIDDPAVTRALLDAARAWLREKGKRTMRGPFSLSINGESGLMVSGQEQGPMIMMPWHPRYLERHLLAAGLTPAKILCCYATDLREFNEDDVAAKVRMPKLPASVKVRSLDLKKLETEVRLITEIFNRAWADNWGFVPLEPYEVLTLAKAFKPFLLPECGSIFEADGQAMAMALILPNLERLTTDFGGRLLPFNWLKLVYRAWGKNYASGRMLLFGVDRKLRGTVLGALAPFAMLSHYARSAGRHPLEELEFSWVLEDNHALKSILERFGCRETKRYAVYEQTIA